MYLPYALWVYDTLLIKWSFIANIARYPKHTLSPPFTSLAEVQLCLLGYTLRDVHPGT